jgi:hypothetical protein
MSAQAPQNAAIQPPHTIVSVGQYTFRQGRGVSNSHTGRSSRSSEGTSETGLPIRRSVKASAVTSPVPINTRARTARFSVRRATMKATASTTTARPAPRAIKGTVGLAPVIGRSRTPLPKLDVDGYTRTHVDVAPQQVSRPPAPANIAKIRPPRSMRAGLRERDDMTCSMAGSQPLYGRSTSRSFAPAGRPSIPTTLIGRRARSA